MQGCQPDVDVFKSNKLEFKTMYFKVLAFQDIVQKSFGLSSLVDVTEKVYHRNTLRMHFLLDWRRLIQNNNCRSVVRTLVCLNMYMSRVVLSWLVVNPFYKYAPKPSKSESQKHRILG